MMGDYPNAVENYNNAINLNPNNTEIHINLGNFKWRKFDFKLN